MTDYAWPSDIPVADASFRLIDGDRVFRSQLSGSVRTEQVHPPYWLGSLTFVRLKAVHGQAIEAYVWRVGKRNRALVPMTDYQRQGAGGGTPRVNGGSQTGLTLATDGWPGSTTVLKAGDRIGVANQAFEIAEDATTSAGGAVTLQLSNNIRTAPADNALLEIDQPVVRCIVKNVFSMSTKPGHFKDGQVEFEEAVP